LKFGSTGSEAVLNRFGAELHNDAEPPRAPVALPELEFLKKGPPLDDGAERREIAAKFLEARTIKTGVECWQAIGRAESFESWVKIGKALQIGRDYSLKATGANRPAGQIYCREFSAWIAKHGFGHMAKSVRSSAIDLAEHVAEIEAWRSTLDERTRRWLVHPLSNVRRWRASTTYGNGKCPQDLRRDVKAAWARLCTCARALPAAESVPLWQTAQRQASEALCR
jgi:hypothetical protein